MLIMQVALNTIKHLKKYLGLYLSIFLLGFTHPVLAEKNKSHHTPSKHSHIKKHHVTKKKHHARKKRPDRYPQLRNPTEETIEANVTSSDQPRNHDLAKVNLTNMSTSTFPKNMMSSVKSAKKNMVDFVQKTVNNLHYSSYKLGGKRFDPERGVYIVDCSNFVDHILQNVNPDAYYNLVDSTGVDNPASGHYFNFFHDLAYERDSRWNKIDDVEELRPGDILVFRYKNSRGTETGGHVMVVMEKPEHASDVYFVKVADSARSRHSEDTRHFHESGIGIGTLLLKANPKTGKPAAFAWGINSYWNKNVKFAMARPLGMGDTV